MGFILNLLGKVLPLVNPAIFTGLLANNVQDGIVTEILGLDDLMMLVVIALIAGVKAVKLFYEKLRQ